MNRQGSNPIDLLESIVPPEFRNSIMSILNQPSSSTSRILTTMTRSANRIVVYAEMPGFDDNTVDVDFRNNQLDISGMKPEPVLLAGETILQSSIKYGRFSTTVTLPISVTNRENVSWDYKDGVLSIAINLVEEEKNRFKINLGSSRKESV